MFSNSLSFFRYLFRNYLVQHLLEKRIWPLTSGILQTLRGHFANLSTQKYSSNVVENCLKNTTSDERESIIRELLWSPNILDIFVDLYGNYVMQTALSVAKVLCHIFSTVLQWDFLFFSSFFPKSYIYYACLFILLFFFLFFYREVYIKSCLMFLRRTYPL